MSNGIFVPIIIIKGLTFVDNCGIVFVPRRKGLLFLCPDFDKFVSVADFDGTREIVIEI